MSTDSSKKKIDKPSGPLTVFLPGVGAVATTFIAGVEPRKERAESADWFADTNGYDPSW